MHDPSRKIRVMASTVQVKCHYCKNPFERPALRPYGPNGSLVCFPCATQSENEPETNKQLGKRFAAAGPVAVVGEGCDNGPEPLLKRRSK